MFGIGGLAIVYFIAPILDNMLDDYVIFLSYLEFYLSFV